MEENVLESGIVEQQDGEVVFAGFWIRVGAQLIDTLALVPLIGLNMAALYNWKLVWLALIINVISLCYKPFLEAKYGATLGKMALNLQVVSTDLKPISLTQSIIRSSPWLANGIYSLVLVIILSLSPEYADTEGFTQMALLQSQVLPSWIQTLFSLVIFVVTLWVAFNSHKRGLHDLMASTYCIKKDKSTVAVNY